MTTGRINQVASPRRTPAREPDPGGCRERRRGRSFEPHARGAARARGSGATAATDPVRSTASVSTRRSRGPVGSSRAARRPGTHGSPQGAAPSGPPEAAGGAEGPRRVTKLPRSGYTVQPTVSTLRLASRREGPNERPVARAVGCARAGSPPMQLGTTPLTRRHGRARPEARVPHAQPRRPTAPGQATTATTGIDRGFRGRRHRRTRRRRRRWH